MVGRDGGRNRTWLWMRVTRPFSDCSSLNQGSTTTWSLPIPKRAHIAYGVSLHPAHQTNWPRARSKYEPITKDGKGDAEGQMVDAEGDWLSVRNGMLRAPRAED